MLLRYKRKSSEKGIPYASKWDKWITGLCMTGFLLPASAQTATNADEAFYSSLASSSGLSACADAETLVRQTPSVTSLPSGSSEHVRMAWFYANGDGNKTAFQTFMFFAPLLLMLMYIFRIWIKSYIKKKLGPSVSENDFVEHVSKLLNVSNILPAAIIILLGFVLSATYVGVFMDEIIGMGQLPMAMLAIQLALPTYGLALLLDSVRINPSRHTIISAPVMRTFFMTSGVALVLMADPSAVEYGENSTRPFLTLLFGSILILLTFFTRCEYTIETLCMLGVLLAALLTPFDPSKNSFSMFDNEPQVSVVGTALVIFAGLQSILIMISLFGSCCLAPKLYSFTSDPGSLFSLGNDAVEFFNNHSEDDSFTSVQDDAILPEVRVVSTIPSAFAVTRTVKHRSSLIHHVRGGKKNKVYDYDSDYE